MKLNQVLRSTPATGKNACDDFRSLDVGEVTLISENPANQNRVPATVLLQRYVVIEFQRQQVNVDKRFHRFGWDAAKIRGIANSPRTFTLAMTLESKRKGRNGIVRYPHGIGRKSVRERQPSTINVSTEQARRAQRFEGIVTRQKIRVLPMKIKRYSERAEMTERQQVPVIAVGMGQDDGGDVRPTPADVRETILNRTGRQAEINEN